MQCDQVIKDGVLCIEKGSFLLITLGITGKGKGGKEQQGIGMGGVGRSGARPRTAIHYTGYPAGKAPGSRAWGEAS